MIRDVKYTHEASLHVKLPTRRFSYRCKAPLLANKTAISHLRYIPNSGRNADWNDNGGDVSNKDG